MLFDFLVADGLPAGGLSHENGNKDLTLWSRLPLQALAPGVLTPFSYSVLSEMTNQAWRQLYDRLGFNPPSGVNVLRQVQGRA